MIIWEIRKAKILYRSRQGFLKLSHPWTCLCKTISLLKILSKWPICNRWLLCSSRWLRWTWMAKLEIRVKCNRCRHKCKTWCLWCSPWCISSLVRHKVRCQEYRAIHSSSNSNSHWIKMHDLRRCSNNKRKCSHNSQKIACLIFLTHKRSPLLSLKQVATRTIHLGVVLDRQATSTILLIFDKKRCPYYVTDLIPSLSVPNFLMQ